MASADALEFKFPNRFDSDGILDCHQHARTDQNLTGLGFIAEPRSDVGHCPNGGVVKTSLEADRAKRRVSVCYADKRTYFRVPLASHGKALLRATTARAAALPSCPFILRVYRTKMRI